MVIGIFEQAVHWLNLEFPIWRFRVPVVWKICWGGGGEEGGREGLGLVSEGCSNCAASGLMGLLVNRNGINCVFQPNTF